MLKIGITERGDAGLDQSWLEALSSGVVDYAILITKDPDKLVGLQYLNNIIIHCTITGLGKDWEPNVPPTSDSIRAYNYLVDKYGPDRVVLRLDPVVPDNLIYWDSALDIITQARGRVRLSFIDAYPHVRDRFLRSKHPYSFYWSGIHAPLKEREYFLKKLQNWSDRKIEVCGEPGIPCTGCVSKLDLEALGLDSSINYPLKGQRSYCQCLSVKKELLSNRHPCAHGCLYCYWKD